MRRRPRPVCTYIRYRANSQYYSAARRPLSREPASIPSTCEGETGAPRRRRNPGGPASWAPRAFRPSFERTRDTACSPHLELVPPPRAAPHPAAHERTAIPRPIPPPYSTFHPRPSPRANFISLSSRPPVRPYAKREGRTAAFSPAESPYPPAPPSSSFLYIAMRRTAHGCHAPRAPLCYQAFPSRCGDWPP